jgi:hypothetical protein
LSEHGKCCRNATIAGFNVQKYSQKLKRILGRWAASARDAGDDRSCVGSRELGIYSRLTAPVRSIVFKRTRMCPTCSASLTCKDIRAAGRFPCPVCKDLLRASEYYPLLTFVASLSLVAVVFVALGFRGVQLFHALLWSIIPVTYLAAHFFKYLILPQIEPLEPGLTRRSLY